MQLKEPDVSIKRSPTKEEIELVMKHGKRYKPAVLPDDIPRGRLGWCFDDSMKACILTNEKYRYVEGLAKATPADKWMLHAWMTDGENAFDPTWYGIGQAEAKGIQLSTYIGIEMPLLAVMLFVKATKYQGVIPNRHMYPHTLETVIAATKGQQ